YWAASLLHASVQLRQSAPPAGALAKVLSTRGSTRRVPDTEDRNLVFFNNVEHEVRIAPDRETTHIRGMANLAEKRHILKSRCRLRYAVRKRRGSGGTAGPQPQQNLQKLALSFQSVANPHFGCQNRAKSASMFSGETKRP